VLGWILVLLVATLVPAIERRAIAGTVASVTGVLRAATFRPVVSEASILVGSHPIEITPDCTPLMPTAALWVAMLAFPATLPWRLAGALSGAAVLWIYNIVRIIAMIGVLNTRPAWFEFLHVYMWQTLTLVVVIGVFLMWLRLEPRPPVLAPPSPSPSG
jgi:exosortase/archaeosortase family protein